MFQKCPRAALPDPESESTSPAPPCATQTYYKLNYVDRRIDSPEQRICEDIPKLCSGLSELTRELIGAAVDATFFSWQLRRYSGTHRYTGAIVAYVFGKWWPLVALLTDAQP